MLAFLSLVGIVVHAAEWTTQSDMLTIAFQGLPGTPFVANSTYYNGTGVCNWSDEKGNYVICTPSPENLVLAVQLSGLGIQGTPGQFAFGTGFNKLPDLIYLNISNNAFTGTLPDYAFASGATVLDVSNNCFDGYTVASKPANTSLSFNPQKAGCPLFGVPSGPQPYTEPGKTALYSLQCIPLAAGFPSVNFGSNCCTWNKNRVTCSKGNIKSIDFSNLGLTGNIPDVFATMHKLDTINLSGNKFTGGLPSSLTYLANGKWFDPIVDADGNGVVVTTTINIPAATTSYVAQVAQTPSINLANIIVNNNCLTGNLSIQLTDFASANNSPFVLTVDSQTACQSVTMTKTVTSTMTTVNVLSTYTPIPGPALDMLVIGDWGTDVDDQFNVAKQMERWASALQSDKVISLGDNFYQGDATYDGIATANDVKFITYWKNVYNGTYLSTLKWWTVLGNHDWYSVGSDAYELMFNDDKWVMPDFFYIKRKQVDDGVFATFIFIETDLFEYGVQAKNKGMQQNFASQGWDQNTNLKQLAWIENAIAQSNKDQYIIVVGHHPTYTCAGDVTDDLGSLYNIINTWNVSAYMNGHSHSMAGYLTNNNRTLQVQAGSGGQTSSTCDPSVDTSINPGFALAMLGFSHLRINKNKLQVDWITDAGDIMYSASVPPRSPAIGVQPLYANYLVSSTDPAVHFAVPISKATATIATVASTQTSSSLPISTTTVFSDELVNSIASGPLPSNAGSSLSANASALIVWASISGVNISQLRSSLIEKKVLLKPGDVTTFIGAQIPKASSGMNLIVGQLTSSEYSFIGVPAAKNFTSVLSLKVFNISNGYEISFNVDPGVVWQWFGVALSSDGKKLTVSVNTDHHVIVSVVFGVKSLAKREESQKGFYFINGATAFIPNQATLTSDSTRASQSLVPSDVSVSIIASNSVTETYVPLTVTGGYAVPTASIVNIPNAYYTPNGNTGSKNIYASSSVTVMVSAVCIFLAFVFV